MRKCFIYSGHLRSYSIVSLNHQQCLGEGFEVHYNDGMNEMDFYTSDVFRYAENKAPETTPAATLNQWHNMYMAFAKAPKGYDVYIRMRYDIELSCPVAWHEYELRDNVVYIANGHDYRDGINDQFAFGNYAAMQKYYSVYLMHKLLFSQGKYFHTESYLKWTLEHFGIEIKRIPVTTNIRRQ